MFCRKLWMTLAIVLFSTTFAHADLTAYLNNLEVVAQADLGDFKAQAAAHFGASSQDLDLVFRGVATPGDAVLCLWLGQQSRRPYDVVMREYHANKKKGWGAMAQSLGIKPGSAEFKALKRGELGWAPVDRSGHGKDEHGEHGGNGHDEHGKSQGKESDKGGKEHGNGKNK